MDGRWTQLDRGMMGNFKAALLVSLGFCDLLRRAAKGQDQQMCQEKARSYAWEEALRFTHSSSVSLFLITWVILEQDFLRLVISVPPSADLSTGFSGPPIQQGQLVFTKPLLLSPCKDPLKPPMSFTSLPAQDAFYTSIPLSISETPLHVGSLTLSCI